MGKFKTEYEGFKMQQYFYDDISDRILPYVKKAAEAYHKRKHISDKMLTEAAVKLIKSKCIK